MHAGKLPLAVDISSLLLEACTMQTSVKEVYNYYLPPDADALPSSSSIRINCYVHVSGQLMKLHAPLHGILTL